LVPCRYELQLRYGSIGWSVGAVLGYSLAARGKQRVLALIGDGSFQMTAQVTNLPCWQQNDCTASRAMMGAGDSECCAGNKPVVWETHLAN
jgi:pimeloyl-ACP methyl ester carboxylesterase